MRKISPEEIKRFIEGHYEYVKALHEDPEALAEEYQLRRDFGCALPVLPEWYPPPDGPNQVFTQLLEIRVEPSLTEFGAILRAARLHADFESIQAVVNWICEHFPNRDASAYGLLSAEAIDAYEKGNVLSIEPTVLWVLA